MRRRLLWNGLPGIGPTAPDVGQPILVIPAFLAHEAVLTRLRRTLGAAGYEARGWGLGLNRGFREGIFDDLERGLFDLYTEHGRRVSLVGWSLGGLFARELAKRRPELVDRVVTLASPFSGSLRANNVWRLYERVAGHSVDELPLGIVPNVKPPVLTIALWTRSDGAVAPASSRGLPGERDLAYEVSCRHCDFVSHPNALRCLLEVLSIENDAVSAYQEAIFAPRVNQCYGGIRLNS